MKKIICCVALAVLTVGAMAGKKAETPVAKYSTQAVTLSDKTDSVNYYLGTLNGLQLSKSAFKEVAAEEMDRAIAAFIDALTEGFEQGDTKDAIAEVAEQIASHAKSEEQTGVIGHKQWVVNQKLMFGALANELLGAPALMDVDSAQAFFSREHEAYFDRENLKLPKPVIATMPGKAVKLQLKTKADSINYAYGFLNGHTLLPYLNGLDSVGNGVQRFIEAFNQTLAHPLPFPEQATTGRQIGNSIRQQAATGLVGVPGLETRFGMIRQGFVNGLYAFGDVAPDKAQAYIEQTISDMRFGAIKAEGAAFLKAKSAEEGCITTASGLVYKVIKTGDGQKPAISDNVKVHYEGSLIDGTVFDSSYRRGEPITFGVTQVIKGWTEMLMLMPVGSKVEAYIPYNLAYGERGAGGQIPPYATLIFTIELLGIE